MKVRLFFRNLIGALGLFLIPTIILSVPAFATVNIPYEEEFSENNIVFYNPTGDNSNKRACSTTDANCNIIGSTKDEKLWSGIRGYGFTPEQTAALMGNFAHEGGTPTRQEDAYNIARDKGCKTQENNEYTIWTYSNEHHSSCMQGVYSYYSAGKAVAGIGLGFVQWTSKDRREGYLNKMDSLGLKDTYFEGDAYKTWGGAISDEQLLAKIQSETGSDSDYWNLWCAAIAFINEELHSGTWNAFFNKTSVEEMAGYISANYEVCNGCGVGQSSYNSRVQSAKEYYQKYQNGDFDAVENGTAPEGNTGGNNGSGGSNSEDGSNVLIIGDSITVRSQDEIKALLPNVTIDAEVGRHFNTGVSILEGKTDIPKIIVFALGTNSNGTTKENAQKVIDKANGSRVIFVTNYSLGAHDYTSNNTLFNSLTGTNVSVADWAGAVSSDPAKYIANEGGSMDVHPTIPDGTKLFAKTLFDKITKSSSSSNCDGAPEQGNGDLNATALALAWPEHGHGLTARDTYDAALKSLGFDKRFEGVDHYAAIGASCDVFVATVFMYSGVDPDFNCCGISGTVEPYIRTSGKFIEVPNNASSLKAGDVRVSGGHVEMVVEVDGVLKIASASHGDRTGEVGNLYDNSNSFKAYRWKGN